MDDSNNMFDDEFEYADDSLRELLESREDVGNIPYGNVDGLNNYDVDLPVNNFSDLNESGNGGLY